MVEAVETGPRLELEIPHTVLFVLGKNIGVGWTADRKRRTPGHLSPHSEVNVDSTAVALEEGLANNVVFFCANTAGSRPLSREEGLASGDLEGIGKPVPSEARLMRNSFVGKYPHLESRIRAIQEKSWDTNGDAKEARKLIDTGVIRPNERVVLMTVGFHHPRAWNRFDDAGVNAYGFISERVLALRDPKRAREYVESDLYKREQKKEAVITPIQELPFAADVITAVTKRKRTK